MGGAYSMYGGKEEYIEGVSVVKRKGQGPFGRNTCRLE